MIAANVLLRSMDSSAAPARVDGSRTRLSGLLGHHLVGRESLIVFYNREGELWAAEIAPASRSVESDTRVAAGAPPSSE